MVWSLVLDVIVAALLVATIVYAGRLNARLGTLRDDRDRLRELITGLQLSTRQAEQAVRDLKLGAAESGHDLQSSIDKALTLKADLTYLLERGEAVAARAEAALAAQRDTARPAPKPAAAQRQASVRPSPMAVQAAEEAAGGQSESHRLSALLRQGGSSSGGEPPAETPAAAEPAADAPKSRSERDLLRALEGRR